ncbi:hypothetical protein LDENG_00229470, partial [Lucifuga dentata]
QSSLSHLQLVQNAAARLLTLTEWVGTAVPLRPFMPPHPSRSLRSADLLLLVIPRSRLKLKGNRAFAGAAPKLWNSLPLHIRTASTLLTFKSWIKTYSPWPFKIQPEI